MHVQPTCFTQSCTRLVAPELCTHSSKQLFRHQNRPRFRRHLTRSADGQQQPNQNAELYTGEASDNTKLQKGGGEDNNLLEDDDEDSDAEERRHGLEELGEVFQGELNTTQDKYKEKLRLKLEADKEAERKRREERSREFAAGRYAYEKGMYAESVELFETASENEGTMSALGGDIQLWLALAFQAVGRDKDCIDLYKRIEQEHPLGKVKRQAAHLRFILEAPKLQRGPDEVVKIPVLEVEERKTARRGVVKRPIPTATLVPKREKTLEERFWDDYQPPKWTQNRYVWWASGILGICLAWYGVSAR